MDRDEDGRLDAVCGGELANLDPAARPENDLDGDGIVNSNDSCPEHFDPCDQDRDRDGVGDRCDTCPDAPNATTQDLDTDGDFRPDACDSCPLVYDPTQADQDEGGFGDGIADACDSCPNTLDGFPTNCNADAERVAGLLADPRLGTAPACDDDLDCAPGVCTDCVPNETCVEGRCRRPRGVGDACDPVPCAETRVFVEEREEVIGGPPGRPGEVRRMDQIAIDARSTEMQDARTGFRFCRCSAAIGSNADDELVRAACELPQGDDTGDCVVDDRAIFAGDGGFEPVTWRYATLDHSSTVSPDTGEPPPLVDPDTFELADPSAPRSLRIEVLLGYDALDSSGPFVRDQLSTWLLDEDRARWSEPPFAEPFMGDEPYPGVLWSHTPGPLGSAFPTEIASLASHYWSGTIAPPVEAPAPFPCLRFIAPWTGGCSICGAVFPTPYISLPGRPVGGGCLGPFEPPVIQIPGPPIQVSDLVRFDAGIFTDPNVQWLPPAEPRELAPVDGPALLGLTSDFTPAFTLVRAGDELMLLDDPQCSPNDPDCNVPLLMVGGAMRNAATTPSPAVPVFSARRELLWMLAGDVESRQGSIHYRSVARDDEGTMREVAIGEVLAATYRSDDDSLYLLDEVRHGRRGRRFVRLLRVDALLRDDPVVLGEWPRLSRHSRYTLSAGPERALWVTASGAFGTYVVVRLEEELRRRRRGLRSLWKPAGWELGIGLIDSASADHLGLSFVVERRGREELHGLRADGLRAVHGGDMRRCF